MDRSRETPLRKRLETVFACTILNLRGTALLAAESRVARLFEINAVCRDPVNINVIRLTPLQQIHVPNRRLKYSIRTLLALTLVAGIGIVSWQYINRPPPPKSAWEAFLLAVTTLQDTGNRKIAARQFEDAERLFPNSEYKSDSIELANLLNKMVSEDRVWREPADPDQLSLQERIKYNIHHLRDVNCYQVMQPGMCHVLSDFGSQGDDNAAMELHRIGEPTIPHLIDLLADRRPLRSVGYWRNFHESRTVLRYQDAAIQILNELLPDPVYGRVSSSGYYSTAPKAEQQRVVAEIKRWWAEKEDAE